MPCFRILIIGAYGQFGRRIAEALSFEPRAELILAGRSLAKAAALLDELVALGARAAMSAAQIDVEAPALHDRLRALEADLVIHTAGPFQQRDYRVAEAALACNAHYIDLADGRAFVAGITRLDEEARTRGRWVISGASSVPGLSAAVVAAHAPRFATLESVESAISPGNRTARGLATTQAILGYVGRPHRALIDGRWRSVHGWQSLRRIRVPGLPSRWLARCDVPDLDVLPARYPTLRHCDFRAGLELRRMHLGLWLASWAVRGRLAPGLERWAQPLLRISEWWLHAGSDTGLMTVDMRGIGRDGTPLQLQWSIVAEQGSGPRIPATAAVVLARKLMRGNLPGAGARPCLDLFTLPEFLDALSDSPIWTETRELALSR
ncbi:saccharopine dehydrogenase family protein [Cognatilysobacter bugurensis]|uniref:Saccharopine dehydrogenase n=1 Tax=Cognatilysobacter bugurensis TaxID=543356 RepID=A0A918STK0_9GAMM|nr:saccharopine dehydrogenase NADP-binding domain-containing protein [Lysobacter bugurensis]GHA69758.1 saccharopine dehydrogenase [Lysobacter bugurensis]